MWAKIAGALPIVPLKARSFPLEGKGDCSGKTTLAEKEPSPTRELLQASRASWLVEGLMWLIRQWGMPAQSRWPAELIAMRSFCSCGRAMRRLGAWIWPLTDTAIGALPLRGRRLVGERAPSTVTLTPCFWETSAPAEGGAEDAEGHQSARAERYRFDSAHLLAVPVLGALGLLLGLPASALQRRVQGQLIAVLGVELGCRFRRAFADVPGVDQAGPWRHRRS